MLFDKGQEIAPSKKRDAAVAQQLRRLHPWVCRLVCTVSLVSWMGLIYYLSSSTPSELPRQIEAFSWLGKLRDVVGHLILYGVLGPLALASLWSWVTGSSYQVRWMLAVIGLGTLYGLLDEYHQSFVPGRAASVSDVVIDSVGVAVGVVSTWYLVKAIRRWQAHGQWKVRA